MKQWAPSGLVLGGFLLGIFCLAMAVKAFIVVGC